MRPAEIGLQLTVAEDITRPIDRAELRLTAPEIIVRRAWPYARGGPLVMPQETAADVQAYAIVNFGRWVVRCPAWPKCLGAQLASAIDTRYFCVDCLHRHIEEAQGKWIEVVWPSSDTILSIERLLMLRPDEKNQNWERHESIQDLEIENQVHGIDRRELTTDVGNRVRAIRRVD